LGYSTVRGEGKMERARWCKTAKSLSQHEYEKWKHFPPFFFDTIDDILILWLYTTQCFVHQRNYKTLAMRSHALTRTRYFLIISYPIVQGRTGLSLRMCYRFAVFPYLPRVYL
jgi:hypothetical protein